MLQKVADAEPWPTMQRFDYLVRTRVLDDAEANIYRETLGREPFPYRDSVLVALRWLTGRDLGTNAQAWRSTLNPGAASP